MAPSLLCWGSVVTMVWGPAKSLGSRSARQQICSKKLLNGISTCPRLSMQTPMFVVWSSRAYALPCCALLCLMLCSAQPAYSFGGSKGAREHYTCSNVL